MLTRHRRGIQAGMTGIADQILLSATNLAIGLALAREMAPASFGIYVVTFALYLMAASVQVALITDPMVVLGSPREGEVRRRYFSTVWRLQCRLSGGLALLVGFAATIAWGFAGHDSELPSALAGLAVALIPLQMQMFLRAVLFAGLRPGAVLVSDLTMSLLRLAMLAWLMMSGWLSTFAVVATAGLAGVAATAVALAFHRGMVTDAPDDLRSTWKEHWAYGRWLLAMSGAWWCSGQAPALLASAMMSPVAAAIIKACQYLVAPLGVAFMGLDGILAPRAARISATRGPAAGRRFLKAVAWGCAAAVLLYAALLLPLAAPLMNWLYKGRYAGHVALVGILLLEALLTAVGRAPTLSLKVAGRTRPLFLANLAGAVAGITALFMLVPSFGVLGVAVAAPVSSGVTLMALLLRDFKAAEKVLPTEGPLVAKP